MLRKVVFVLVCAAVAASAKSYTVNLFETATLGATELQPGAYQVEVNGDKAMIRNGKVHEEAPVKVENGDIKYDRTTVRFDNAGGKMKIQEIRLGGTKMKLVFM